MITELMFTNNAPDFVQTTLDDDNEFTEADVVVTDDIYDDRLVIVYILSLMTVFKHL